MGANRFWGRIWDNSSLDSHYFSVTSSTRRLARTCVLTVEVCPPLALVFFYLLPFQVSPLHSSRNQPAISHRRKISTRADGSRTRSSACSFTGASTANSATVNG